MVDFLFIDTSKVWTTAAGIERGSAQGGRLWLTRGEEATLGATAARSQPSRPPRTTRESPLAALNLKMKKLLFA